MDKGSELTLLQKGHTDGQYTYEKMLNITNHQRNANKTTVRYHFTLSEWLSSINQQTTSAGEDVEKGEPFCTVGGTQTSAATVESNMELPQKIKNGTAFCPNNSTSGNNI